MRKAPLLKLDTANLQYMEGWYDTVGEPWKWRVSSPTFHAACHRNNPAMCTHYTYHSHWAAENFPFDQVLHELFELEAEHTSNNVWAIVRSLARQQSLLDLWPLCKGTGGGGGGKGGEAPERYGQASSSTVSPPTIENIPGLQVIVMKRLGLPCSRTIAMASQ